MSVADYVMGKGKLPKSQRKKRQLPKTVVLWHGTPAENLQSILKHGIMLKERSKAQMIRQTKKQIKRVRTELDFMKGKISKKRYYKIMERL